MSCPRCQSQVADGTKFCGVCGSPMNVGAQPTPPPPPAPPFPIPAPPLVAPPDPDAGENGSIDSCSAGSVGYNGHGYCSDQGILMGHFVKYVAPPGTGQGSGQCTANTLGICIGILTK